MGGSALLSPFSADLKLNASVQASLRAEARAERAAAKAAAKAAEAMGADRQETGPLPGLAPSIEAQPKLDEIRVPEAPAEA